MFENFMIQVKAAWLLSHAIVCLISVISNTFPSTGVIWFLRPITLQNAGQFLCKLYFKERWGRVQCYCHFVQGLANQNNRLEAYYSNAQLKMDLKVKDYSLFYLSVFEWLSLTHGVSHFFLSASTSEITSCIAAELSYYNNIIVDVSTMMSTLTGFDLTYPLQKSLLEESNTIRPLAGNHQSIICSINTPDS